MTICANQWLNDVGFDPLGNWDSTVVDSTTETRRRNSVNELTARTIGQDPQISLTCDAAGNSPYGETVTLTAITSTPGTTGIG